MKIVKLPWLVHQETHRRFEIYSIDISPDGKRIATGGLDGKIRIWSVDNIKIAADLFQKTSHVVNEELKRPLASMSRHTGSVTCLKFSPDGKYLASGSDDRILLIWTLEEEHITLPTFGSEPETERWTVRRRLVAHDNDIQDMCWAPDSSILVTVGLDRSVIIWNGSTFERIKRFDVHNSLVKGVIFDPANKYFATTSDDRTMKIFRYHRAGEMSFTIESIVTEPFLESPLTTYFRRLSWSPDGQHIAVPNATNGPVSSVVIVNRGNWDTSVSLIGHDAPTEVARFNPRLFEVEKSCNKGSSNSQKDNEKSKFTKNDKVDSIIATAGQDKTLAVWSTSRARPIFVAYDIATKSITDMCWNPDGDILFVTSLDGTITVLLLQKNELGIPISIEKNIEHLHRYGVDKDSLEFPESVKQLLLEGEAEKEISLKSAKSKNLLEQQLVSNKQTQDLLSQRVGMTHENKNLGTLTDKKASELPTKTTEKINILVPKRKKDGKSQTTTIKNGKKRVAPMLISSEHSPNKKVATQKLSTSVDNIAKRNKSNLNKLSPLSLLANKGKIGSSSINIPRLGIHTLIMGTRERELSKSTDHTDGAIDEDSQNKDTEKVPNQDNLANITEPTELGNSPSLTLNSKFTYEKVWSEEPNSRYVEYPNVILDTDAVLIQCGDLEEMYVLEIRNGVERSIQFDREAIQDNPTKLLGYHSGKRVLEVYLPEVIICAIGSVINNCWCIGTANGSLFFFSLNGRHKMPMISLGHKIVKMRIDKQYLICLGERGLIFVWDLTTFKAVHKNIPVMPVLFKEPVEGNKVRVNKKIRNISVSPSENVILNLTNANTYTWSKDLGCWTDDSTSTT
ncbi:hypothetical protein TBLA_0C04110 [Henningerozyma blattae CBS 6284]|uniref:Protein HIR n=1 Tax=Henningerozyma blattae (strain ATCC 34711 / CBS 6284 / DSM 70876 / NBRC 10599 / NRRL Y-10934 / UCD 77-7) TaxID=1071380 RepID=I2H1F9_HENB6|nr:hypothetical protein TBLA_0C04110 [Tetrapisispora blattae CBS 6284]CCH60211.1 hypothetical protein TBLA_0C04110 [Tetrapisispora blattae CBS 6284]